MQDYCSLSMKNFSRFLPKMLSVKEIWNNRGKQINITWKKYKPISVGRNWATYLFLNNNFTTIIWAFHRILLTFFNVILWICKENISPPVLFIFSSTFQSRSSSFLFSRKFRYIQTKWPTIRRLDRQTDRQTDMFLFGVLYKESTLTTIPNS